MGRLELPVGGRAATLFPPSFSRAYRGNGSKVMRVAQQQRGVVAARAGNLPLGLAYHGKRPGIPVTAVAPFDQDFALRKNECPGCSWVDQILQRPAEQSTPSSGRRDRGDNFPGGGSVIVLNLHANAADRESVGTGGLHGEFIGDVGRDAAPLKCGSDKVSLDQEVDVGDGGHRVRL